MPLYCCYIMSIVSELSSRATICTRECQLMKKPMFTPLGLLKEAFLEIDDKTRRNLYIYLWYSSCLYFIVTLARKIFILSLPEEGTLHPAMEISFIIFSIINLFVLIHFSLWKTTNVIFEWLIKIFIFELQLQTFPYVYIFLGMFSCFRFLTGQSSIYTVSSITAILDTIVALWALRYILRLRRHALRKIN